MTHLLADPDSLIGPSFLNRPSTTSVGGKFRILTQALLYHYAGPRPSQELVDASIKAGDFSEIRQNYPGVIIIPAGLVTDGPSVPGYLVFVIIGLLLMGVFSRWMGDFSWVWVLVATGVRASVDPSKFMFAGYLHDFLCVWLLKGRAAADGFLRVACAALGMGWWPCYAVYLGVRLGTFIRYKTKVPEAVRKQALIVFAKSRGLLISDFQFDERLSMVVRK